MLVAARQQNKDGEDIVENRILKRLEAVKTILLSLHHLQFR